MTDLKKLATKTNLRRAIQTGMTAHSAYGLIKNLYNSYWDKRTYYVSVPLQGSLGRRVANWAIETVPEDELKNLRAEYASWKKEDYVLYALTNYSFTTKLDGQKIKVNFYQSEGKVVNGEFHPAREELTLSSRSFAGAKAIDALLKDIGRKVKAESDYVSLYLTSGATYSNWNDNPMPKRGIDQVILRAGQREEIISDLQLFLDSKDKYTSFGIPYHRGYLFYGPPGTGKTSFVNALANEMGLDLYVLNLDSVKTEAKLLEMLSSTSKKKQSILLIEDIDRFKLLSDKEIKDQHISLSVLLSAFDGLATPSGLILIMTTNHIDRLDEALIRSGRIDVKQKFDLLDHDHLLDLYSKFYGVELTGIPDKVSVSPADIVEVFKKNFTDPQGAAKVIREMLTPKVETKSVRTVFQ